jgi:predicted permease
VATRLPDLDSFHGLYYQDYLYYRDNKDAFSDLIAFMPAPVNLSDGTEPERIWTEVVSGNFFSSLGVGTEPGRAFLPEEGETPTTHPVVVLSHAYWQKRFAGDRSVIGKVLKLNGYPFTVIGVTQENFRGTVPLVSIDAYLPAMMLPQLMPGGAEALESRAEDGFRVMGHLKPGVSVDYANKVIAVLARQLEQQYPLTNKGRTTLVVPETQARPDPEIGSYLPPVSLIFMTLVGMVLLIACTNVVTLILARTSARRKEIAIRAALGASRARIIRQLLTESLILAVLGGGAALLLAHALMRVLSSVRLPVDFPFRLDLAMDWRVFSFTLCVALLAGVVTGLIPALQATRVDLNKSLKEGARDQGAALARQWIRSGLVVSQIAVSLLLLICSGLFIQSLLNTQKINLGFRTDNLLLVSMDVSLQGYDRNRGARFYKDVIERVKNMPGVVSVSLASYVPLGITKGTLEVFVEGQSPANPLEDEGVGMYYNAVSPDYFRTVGTSILEGRDFTEQDSEVATGVAIINETLARRFWPAETPLGKRFKVRRDGPLIMVVGVAQDSKFDWLYEGARPFIYLPMSQSSASAATLYVHTATDPLSLVAPVREYVSSLDTDLPLYEVKTMHTHINEGPALFPARLGTALVATFGFLGLLLTAVGVYGVASFSASQRTREIGIRMALGARPGDILKLIIGKAIMLTAAGVAIGVIAAFAFTRVISSLLFGVSPTDPVTFLAISIFLSGVALLSSYFPARRASKVDPIVVLKQE